MTNIVWIYGSSAAGKETFIHQLLKGSQKDLIDRLGWSGKKLVYIEESIKYIGQFRNDPIDEKRQQIVERAKKLSTDPETVILIKGQCVDFKFDSLNKLREQTPNAKHEIIFLHADSKILFERSRRKSWWSDEDEQEGFEGFKKWLVEFLIKPLQDLDGFTITALNSEDYEYKSTIFPPKIDTQKLRVH